MTPPLRLPSAFVALLLCLTACSTRPHVDKASETTASTQQAATRIEQTSTQIDVTMAALADLLNNPAPNLKPQFTNYHTTLSKLESLNLTTERDRTEMQNKFSSYLMNWDRDLSKIQNKPIHMQSLERKNAVALRYDTVRLNYIQAIAQLTPLITQLKDIRTALKVDLTVGGLAAIRSSFEKANQQAGSVHTALAGAAADIRWLSSSFSTTAPETVSPH